MARLTLTLGLDAGGSATKWALCRAGVPVAAGQSPPLTAPLLHTAQGPASLQALQGALPGQPSAVHVGLPGLSRDTAAAEAVADTLAHALGVGRHALSVESDLDLAYRAHLAPGAGVLLYAGTGSVAYHVTRNGQVVRAGGRGFLIGDDGAGFSLGRAALRFITDQLDAGEVPGSPLAREVAAVTGGLDWDTLRAFAYAAPGAGAVARLAPAVGRAADAGDPVAQALLQDAAQALAALARRVQARTAPLPVTATGGALRISPLFTAALGRALPGVSVQQRDHAQAAARYAERHLG
ncbi:N-acetylglucosamine kinase [Deinococcus multiflagellatus]|uniref:N-acetylglucosamine kinase n=1 Tax=Deinococcus multiflagellatus TaxID=1656887 RepID=UPI001CCC3DD3|nr:BadF/BadG/BcrA/BcrD ATPase family protein [Deinococcus multiflagellatus]MBZ9713515.1 ATPase [Deinococcus multiflagellatus]